MYFREGQLMKEITRREMTILFADVAGSVRLYSALGDIEAHRKIVNSLHCMSSSIKRYQGRVIATIGDEIMCSFNMADNALDAACELQEKLSDDTDSALFARIGIHSSLTSEDNGSPFGDTVNIAARVVALAKAGQIMLTDDVWQRLAEPNRARTRYFSNTYLKGKSEPYTIHQALWSKMEATAILLPVDSVPVSTRPSQPGHILIRHQINELTLTEGTELLLGRGEQCNLKIVAEAASRIHATLKCHAGKLLLTDRSANGTYVTTLTDKTPQDDPGLYFHHKEWVTSGSGIISLGTPVENDDTNLVYFKCI
jgi:adenylate cyclase